MMLKAGDKIRFKHTGEEYEITWASSSNLAYFSRQGVLSCPFEVSNPFDIRKSEFEVQYNPIHWEYPDGTPLFETPKKYSIGSRFRDNDDEYLLAQVGFGTVCLINLSGANRYQDPVSVSDAYAITAEEFYQITCQQPESFTLVE